MNIGSHVPTLRRAVAILLGMALLLPLALSTSAASRGQASLADIRAATAKFHDLKVAEAAGYVPFYICTDEAGVGAMGQHYVNLALVGDPAIDPLQPEALVYEPMPDGSLRFVAVEYVTFQGAWHDAFGDTTPTVVGQSLKAVGSPNRYGLPPFFQRHVWLWLPNPLGMYNDWNSKATCRGHGDPA